MSLPEPGEALPRRGNAVSRWLGRTLLKLIGWRFEGTVPNHPKMVVIAAPHTTNWDFPITMLVALGLGLEFHFLGKHTLFRPPLGWLMQALGGIAVDRTARQGVVAQAVAEFEARERFLLGLAPEGTRKRVERWRTGFYHIAYGAGVPILPAYIDYPSKTVGVGPALQPTGDLEAEVERLRAFYAPFRGKKA